MPPMGNGNGNDERRITYFATTHTRGKREMFGIRALDRSKHMYVIGKTGMGKSTLLENLAIQDIQNGEGIIYIDPHGSTAEKLLDFIPHDRINDVVYFAPFDTDCPVGFNVMEDMGPQHRHLVVSGLMGAFKRIWVDAWSARMEYILQNVLLALLEYPGSTLIDVNRMLTNKAFRAAVVASITDPLVKSFWVEEFAGYTDRYTQEATPAIQNKVGQFVANPLIRNIVGQPKSTFDLRKIMDEKKIFIANFSKGRMGESNAQLLGSMLTVKVYLAAMSRAEEPAARLARLPRCFFYVDEFQSMMNEAFAAILSESRKYKLALTLANQYVEQMEENVRNAVFGNIGTFITFRVGPFDAEVLKTMFEPTFLPEDLVNLGVGQVYLTLMVDGVGTPPFSAETIPPIDAPDISYKEDALQASRKSFGIPRSEVEKHIMERQTAFAPDPPKPKEKRDYGAPRPSQGGGGGGGGNPGGGNSYGNQNYQRRDVRRDDRPQERPQERPTERSQERPQERQPDRAFDRPTHAGDGRDSGGVPNDGFRGDSPQARTEPRDTRPPHLQSRTGSRGPERGNDRGQDNPRREPKEMLSLKDVPAKSHEARMSLKDAIASATASAPSAQAPKSADTEGEASTKSPLELLRAKKMAAPQAGRVQEEAKPMAHTSPPTPQPVRPTERRDTQKEEASREVKSEPTPESVEVRMPKAQSAVSQELLEKILNGE